jgi:hydrogenase/urease accessory protein HupE
MNTRFTIFIALWTALLWPATTASAHRLDEYLQASTFALEKNHISLRMHLTPGVAVLSKVLAEIDKNADGVISASEQDGYAQLVLREISLTLDNHAVALRLTSTTFPTLPEMRDGLGEIVLDFQADIPGGGIDRTLTFENHHQSAISVYLANCLVPTDPTIHVISQDRNYDQSFYQLKYSIAEPTSQPASNTTISNAMNAAPGDSSSRVSGWLDRTGSESLFKAFFFHGVHHILTGYDHLLFVSALVLAATTLWDLIKVVSTFTLAHTITLTLAALNLVHLSERIVEPLISASIVFVALQNVFWPRKARGWSRLGAAFFFGLFHGLGFAGGLLDAMREMQSGTMFLAIFAFSVGVETGHQMIVLPLFAILKSARRSQPDAVTRMRYSMSLQRIGSAGISVAGAYYLCLALTGNS